MKQANLFELHTLQKRIRRQQAAKRKTPNLATVRKQPNKPGRGHTVWPRGTGSRVGQFTPVQQSGSMRPAKLKSASVRKNMAEQLRLWAVQDNRKQKVASNTLPAVLRLVKIASSLDAGRSLPQAVKAACDDCSPREQAAVVAGLCRRYLQSVRTN